MTAVDIPKIRELMKHLDHWEAQGHSTVGIDFLRRHFADSLLALVPEPASEDEREALARSVYGFASRYVPAPSHLDGWNAILAGVHAAGFRRPRPLDREEPVEAGDQDA